MARRKSLLGTMYTEYQKGKRQREREQAAAQRQWEAEQRRIEAAAAKQYAAQVREQERAEQAWHREQARLARVQQQEHLKAERQAAQQEKERLRRQAQALREQQQRDKDVRRRQVDIQVERAQLRTDEVQRRVADCEMLLLNRNRDLADYCSEAEDALVAEGEEGFAEVISSALSLAAGSSDLHGSCKAVFRPEARELLLDYELPSQDVIPSVSAHRYVKAKDVIAPVPRKEVELKSLYEKTVARVALRTLAEGFLATPAALVDGIIFNGHVSAKDPATGKPIKPLLISVHAMREAFGELVLDEPELDPKSCLKTYLNAVVSAHPFDLEPVRPVVQYDISKYKTTAAVDVLAGLDSRIDLLELSPSEFEQLVRALFEQMGMKSWVTQSSRDDGVDAVAVNEDPIVGGLCIIQAKRYSRVVGLEAIHALAGVMNDKSAAKGVLVTTSWVGKASRDFAARNGRMEIIEGRELKSLLAEHLGRDVLIGLPKLPPGWEPHQVK
ncbi:restriction endonuclease [Mycobacteroides abscessus]|uniref:restriction endonuclease n=1 Tax=Mycobacteroides abscessus TaxID=36809 RepID=UPI0009266FBD|nr:restriction endonuclease [Mycobacteroides abscessus]SHT29224.1 restriction system protein MRR [Mycobacteroides abscessus subsp. abscessus]SHX01138.1 restriction system protein MRR [Mycobacteroides abscessus subsp. abscessus]SKG95179.1 restriction system protein MRR [Mycobacteroides abscessus subsp. abscessus]SKH50166.1 restriction system protein MRR [Mycobacteroides abscessus subsp. abscessus]SKH66237.1 restriction system protein MRR [Mycobacteroides abscessus subsp. abscessus]